MESRSPALNLDWLHDLLWPIECGGNDAVLILSLFQATARDLPCFLSLPSAVSTRLDSSMEPLSRRRENEHVEKTEAPQLTSSLSRSSCALLTCCCPQCLREPGRDQHPPPLAESSPQNHKLNRWWLFEALSPGVTRDTAGPPLHVPSSTLTGFFLRHHCGTWEVGFNSSKCKRFLKITENLDGGRKREHCSVHTIYKKEFTDDNEQVNRMYPKL